MSSASSPDALEPQWKRQIRELQDLNRRAFLAADVDRLRGLWSDDLLVNSPINRVHDKNQVLDLLQRGIIRHVSLEEHVEVATRQGDLVIVMGRDEVSDVPGSPPIARRFTNVWRASGSSWELIARHANVVARP